jgi:hypothetical protein
MSRSTTMVLLTASWKNCVPVDLKIWFQPTARKTPFQTGSCRSPRARGRPSKPRSCRRFPVLVYFVQDENSSHVPNPIHIAVLTCSQRKGGGEKYWSTGRQKYEYEKFVRAFPLNFQRALHGSSRIITTRCNNDKAPVINDYVSCCRFCSTSKVKVKVTLSLCLTN